MKTILLFGTFDGIHAGHRFCFSEARKLCDHVVVAVAPDSVVRELKGRPAKQSAEERAESLKGEECVDEVVVGDQSLGSYEVVTTINPDMIGLGYDQHELAEDLRTWAQKNLPKLSIVRFESFEPETYKSSLL